MINTCNYSIVCLIDDCFETHVVIDDVHYLVADVFHENDVDTVFRKAEDLKPAYAKVIILNNHVIAVEALRIQQENLLKELEQNHGI